MWKNTWGKEIPPSSLGIPPALGWNSCFSQPSLPGFQWCLQQTEEFRLEIWFLTPKRIGENTWENLNLQQKELQEFWGVNSLEYPWGKIRFWSSKSEFNPVEMEEQEGTLHLNPDLFPLSSSQKPQSLRWKPNFSSFYFRFGKIPWPKNQNKTKKILGNSQNWLCVSKRFQVFLLKL